jgi:hypothetical protein
VEKTQMTDLNPNEEPSSIEPGAAKPQPRWSEWFAQQWRLREQSRELGQLRSEVAKLTAQNQRIQQAIRRCIPCDYRIESLARRNGEDATPLDS